MVRETAAALRGLGMDLAGLVTSSRRIVEKHPTSGPLWWLCARVLNAPEPLKEASVCAREIDADPTTDVLVDLLPQDAVVCVVGWPDLLEDALIRRGDVSVFVVDGSGGDGFARRLERSDVDVTLVAPQGAAAAVISADLLLVEATLIGPDGVIAATGSRAAAAVAYCDEVPVWLVGGVGRRLPAALWTHAVERLSATDEPWESDEEIVPLALFSHVIGPNGLTDAPGDAVVAECPHAPELLRSVDF